VTKVELRIARLKIIGLLEYLLTALETDGDRRWTRVLGGIIAIGEDEILSDSQALQEMARSYGSLMQVPDGFNSAFIWREDFDERIRVNAPYDAARDQLCDIFKQSS
jgi:hypothetical protein